MLRLREPFAAFAVALCAVPAFAQSGSAADASPETSSAQAARRAELLRQREAIDAELKRLEAPTTQEAGSTTTAPAAEAAHRDELETVLVTGPRARSDVVLPAGQSAASVGREQFEHMPAVNIAEVLAMAPGVTFVQGNGPRDVSVSIRGSNNRQTFGVRNIKVFEDGFDVTQPDGLARTDLTDPHAYGRIDVVRGPSSAWYGNYATGGAIDFRSRSGADIRGVETGLDGGSYGYLNAYVTAGDAGRNYDYVAFFSNVRGGGATAHTDFLTTTANLLATVDLTPRDRLVFKFIDNELDTDLSQRLSLNQYRQNPYQRGCDTAGAAATAAGCASMTLFNNGFNNADGVTPASPAQAGIGRHDRRTIAGARWEHEFDDATLWTTQAVFDNRDIKQPTGASGFDGSYPSFNLRSDVRHQGTLLGLGSVASAGLFYNYEEINSSTYNLTPDGHATHGGVLQQVAGHHLNTGVRLRDELQVAEQWTAVVGLGGEYTQMEGLSTAFKYPAAATPTTARIDATREFFNVAPDIAIVYAPTREWTLHARAAAAYGTPQLTNLFVTSSGDAGNNTQLDPQRNVGFDLGAEWHWRDAIRASVSGFYEFFRNELITQVATPSTSYTYNAPRSEHRGVELALDWKPLPQALPGAQVLLSYIYDDQIYRDYTENLVAGTAVVGVSRDGNRIPGVQPQYLNARLAYDQPVGVLQGLGAYVELNWRDDYTLDNANLLKAPGYELVNLNVHYQPSAAAGVLSRCDFYFAVQNVFDKTYVGSAGNLADRLNADGTNWTAEQLAGVGGSIYAGTPRVYYGGVRVRF
ncbi:MAG: TonB-dependent receptor family protein [Solimonas sp.]